MKVIVAHPDQQHSYRLATALKHRGMLNAYCTTVYYKKGGLTQIASRFLPSDLKKRAQNRRCNELDDAEVIQFCECEALIKLLSLHVPALKHIYTRLRYHVADRFAKKVARYAIKYDVDAVITYDDCSPILFEILKHKAPKIKRILDTSAANRLYMKEIYEIDTKLQPKFAHQLREECYQVWDKNVLDRIQREIRNSEFFLSPSTFVNRSLAFSKIAEEDIYYCPYGVDIEQFKLKQKFIRPGERIKFVYVGGTKELKGISYLINAFREFDDTSSILTVVGDYTLDEDYKKIKNIHFTGRVPHDKVSEILMENDVFVFPSLGDSFSLSALEAAATGLPLILSDNTGLADFVNEGEEGFVIRTQDTEDLKDKIKWFINNAGKIKEMGMNAHVMARKLTWNQYYEKVSNAVSDIVSDDTKR